MDIFEIEKKKSTYKKLIIVISIIIPVVIAILFGVKVQGYDLTFLPPIYATLNGLTAIFLISAFVAIKNRKRKLHEKFMKSCIIMSGIFLLFYVLYHMTSESTPFGGKGSIRYVYYTVLISHILLSIGVIPLVLLTYLKAWLGDFEKHKALAKFTFPIWLYVAVTGVIIYLMISPYYASGQII